MIGIIGLTCQYYGERTEIVGQCDRDLCIINLSAIKQSQIRIWGVNDLKVDRELPRGRSNSDLPTMVIATCWRVRPMLL